MKMIFSLLVLASFNANASAFLHVCDVQDADSEIAKVDIIRGHGAPKESLSIYYKDETAESFPADYYNDMTFIGYITEDKKFDLYLNEVNEDGVWTEGTLSYGDHLEKKLKVVCQ